VSLDRVIASCGKMPRCAVSICTTLKKLRLKHVAARVLMHDEFTFSRHQQLSSSSSSSPSSSRSTLLPFPKVRTHSKSAMHSSAGDGIKDTVLQHQNSGQPSVLPLVFRGANIVQRTQRYSGDNVRTHPLASRIFVNESTRCKCRLWG
jgi:hypothetical protein